MEKKYTINCGYCNDTGKRFIKKMDAFTLLDVTREVECEFCTYYSVSDMRKQAIERQLVLDGSPQFDPGLLDEIDRAIIDSQNKKTMGGLKK